MSKSPFLGLVCKALVLLSILCAPAPDTSLAEDSILLFLPAIVSPASPPPPFQSFFPLETGITNCYGEYSQVITCPPEGQDYHGLDGQYNSPNRQFSFTDHYNGTISDMVLGLMWQQTDDGVERTQSEANSYCSALELGGFSDWRLPAVHELFNILDLSRKNPAVDPVFAAEDSFYMTRDVYSVSGVNYPWLVDFSGGRVSFEGWFTEGPHYVRCVRERDQ